MIINISSTDIMILLNLALLMFQMIAFYFYNKKRYQAVMDTNILLVEEVGDLVSVLGKLITKPKPAPKIPIKPADGCRYPAEEIPIE
jgi:hypothetical protein